MKIILPITFFAAFLFSCNSAPSEDIPANEIKSDSSISPKDPPEIGGNAKLMVFNNVNDIRIKLSSVGIGQLGTWKDDQMGGYMSITNYYQFGDEILSNNLAYYLISDNKNYIKQLQLVVNINDKKKQPALKKFADVIEKTYKALDLEIEPKILAAAKTGKEILVDKETHTEKIKLEKTNIESFQFLIISK